ncbi:extracellular solute-binding protein [Paenibacillus senegalensis]|uniref:extracellular solute-binding protein n=1 Tax=Paenibacillus senegalensis TaxID=1465766 RepID=UPI000287E157|nr:extracellular solute-binding protein [Paenibacillus senegalensis]
MTITAMKFGYGELPPNDGPGVQAINERFNVDYQITQVPVASYGEKLSAVFASGSIPDMIAFEASDLNNRYVKFAQQNAFLALDDYIEDYPSLKVVPDFVWDQFRVDGKIYAIPKYYPRFGFLPMIRQDWLDNLGLDVPTNYEELKEVALAFTRDDPDGNGKDDTYGIALGKDINPNYNLGAYWDPGAWYHKNEDGNFIPGIISEARKEFIELLAELYQANAITRDFATLDWNATNKEFYSGTAGIFIGTPRGMIQANSDSLLALDPNAKFTFMAPAVAPDGSQGLASSSGFVGFMTISAEAGKDPDKVRRILDITEVGRGFIPVDEMNPDNPDYDWIMGGIGIGYDVTDGEIVVNQEALKAGVRPTTYLLDDVPWPENEADKVYSYANPILNDVVQEMLQLHGQSKFYGSPHYAVPSPTQQTKGAELNQFLLGEQSKMITGQRPISEWEAMVEEWMAKGGADWIKEVNEGTTLENPEDAWE